MDRRHHRQRGGSQFSCKPERERERELARLRSISQRNRATPQQVRLRHIVQFNHYNAGRYINRWQSFELARPGHAESLHHR